MSDPTMPDLFAPTGDPELDAALQAQKRGEPIPILPPEKLQAFMGLLKERLATAAPFFQHARAKLEENADTMRRQINAGRRVAHAAALKMLAAGMEPWQVRSVAGEMTEGAIAAGGGEDVYSAHGLDLVLQAVTAATEGRPAADLPDDTDVNPEGEFEAIELPLATAEQALGLRPGPLKTHPDPGCRAG